MDSQFNRKGQQYIPKDNIHSEQQNKNAVWQNVDFSQVDQKFTQYIDKQQQQGYQQYPQPQQHNQYQQQNFQQQKQINEYPPKFQQYQKSTNQTQKYQSERNQQDYQFQNNQGYNTKQNRNQIQNTYKKRNESSSGERRDDIIQQSQPNLNPEQRPSDIEQDGLNYLRRQKKIKQLKLQEEQQMKEQRRYEEAKHNKYLNKKAIEDCLRKSNPCESLIQHFKQYYPKFGQITFAIDNIKIDRFRNFIELMHQMVDALLVSANYIPYIEEIFNSQLYQTELLTQYNDLVDRIHYKNAFETNLIIKTLVPFIKMCIKFLTYSSNSLCCPLCTEDVQRIFEYIEKANHPRLQIIQEEYKKFKQLFEDKLKVQEQKVQQRQIYDETLINYDVCPAQPVSEELMQQKNIPYFGTITKVLQSEAYANVESYLNNNFYILREDYMRDFRTAIFRLRECGFDNLDRDVLQFVFIYTDLNLEDVRASNNGVIYTVSFMPYDMRKRRIDWAKNNRLMTGSLLAFTRADFSMFVFASVHYKNPKKLQEYYDKTGIIKIQIKLFGDKLIDCIQELNKLMMSQQQIYVIENKIYFETYIHYLRCIQQIDPMEFPLKDQLVYSKKGSPIPKYFGNAKSVRYGIHLKYDLKQPTNYVFRDQIDILQPWNNSIKESLDDSQFRAIQLMIRSGLAIVQGPPGTGKTYCGALAIRILLNNQQQWNPDQQNELFYPDRRNRQVRSQVQSNNKPILVVCNTNHALDQFLSHILVFTKPEDVVRIGGRCKVEKIKQLQLKQVERARFDDHDHRHKYYTFKQVQKLVQRDVSNMLNSADNVAFADFVEFQENLVDMIVNDFCLREDLSFYKPINLENMRYIFYLWMDNKKPRDEHVNKIIDSELKLGNKFIRDVDFNKKIQWRGQMVYREPLDLQIGLSQEQIIRMLQSEYDGIDENENIDSDDENNRKAYDNNEIDPESKETLINQARKYLKRLGLDQQKLIKIQEKLNSNNVSPWELNSNERFVLTSSVFVKRYDSIYEKAISGIEEYDELNKELQERYIEEDLKLIQSKKIVGATVTGCAKYAQKFDQLNFSIMVIEEAAEVLESHTVAILKKSVEHLILIGDHLQLKPKLQSYYLEIKYQPNISLFERLVNNQVEYVTLTNQRRMKSKFADFIRLIYDNYQDHPDIMNYQNKQEIYGLESDLIFFDHRVLENNDQSTNSKSNMFEAQMIVKMVGYLVKNGTDPREITILATYMKQALIIKKLAESERLFIRIQTIDNYQGEENEYVFLSLVRSNKTRSLGFVNIDNRVCVALSRARIGMFIFGNFKFIYDTVLEKVKEGKGTDLWLRIIQLAKQKKVISDYIGLQCQSHKKKVEIRTVEDWKQVTGGGCNVDCNIKFDCGHVCKEKCHKFDHIRANCKSECDKILECGHKCKALCKKVDCPPCNWKVQKQLKCGHYQDVACSQKSAPCQQKCNKILICGHKCQMLCQDPCDQRRCYEYKDYTVPKCGHKIQIKCNTISDIVCTKKCEVIQSCGHPCNGTCGGCLEGTFHQPCDKKCQKILRCGHECDRKCGQPCSRCNKPCSFQCCVVKCQLKCGEICLSCQNKCQYHCDHQRCKMKCFEDCDREPCNEECKLILECGCKCSGLCGEKCPLICKLHNKEGYDLFFGNEVDEDAKFYALECPSEHVFEVQMLDYYFQQKYDELERDGGHLSYIRCPKCNLIISQSSRYQKYIKSVQKNLNEIKRIENQYMLINIDDIDDLRDKIIKLLKQNNNKDPESFLQQTQKFLDIQASKLNKGLSSEIIRHEYNCIKNQLEFYEYGLIIQSSQIDNQEFNIHKRIILKEYLFNSDLFYRANDQFWERLAIKIETMKIYLQLLNECKNDDQLIPHVIMIEDDNYNSSQQELQKYRDLLELQEIKQITKAVLDAGQGQGHWFKCPNGHFFAIGNCGGAMELSKCVDCGAEIGGQQHKLLQTNKVATEIDGATEDAYTRLQRQNGNI